jgi:hypothetical protein
MSLPYDTSALVEVTLRKYPTRAGFEITLEASGGRFLLKCQVGFEFPRTAFRRVRVGVGPMLAQALPQITGRADVETIGHGNGFKNLTVVHSAKISRTKALVRFFALTKEPLDERLRRKNWI